MEFETSHSRKLLVSNSKASAPGYGSPSQTSPTVQFTNSNNTSTIYRDTSDPFISSSQKYHLSNRSSLSSDCDQLSFTDIPLAPSSPTASTSSSLQQSPIESRFPHTSSRQNRQSLSDCIFEKVKLPSLLSRASTVSSRANSPTRSQYRPRTPQTPTNTASSANTRASHRHSKSLFENFFSPYASPGPEEYPEPEHFEMDPSYTRSRKSSNASFTNSVGGRLGWLKNKAFQTPSRLSSTQSDSTQRRRQEYQITKDDPLLNLDINSQLFPDGPVDPLDPASFHTLLSNATSLIEALSGAYKSRTQEYIDISSEIHVQTDELDEAETRARHLKMQLSDMSSRMSETESSLRAQLLEERSKREQAEAEVHHMQETRQRQRSSSIPSDSGIESDMESAPSSVMNSPIFKTKVPTVHFPTQSQDRVWNYRASIAVPMQGGGDLRTENAFLKQRVIELEGAVDACLQLL